MNHPSFYNTLKTKLNTAIDNIIAGAEKHNVKISDSIAAEQNNFYQIDNLKCDEYGNADICNGVC